MNTSKRHSLAGMIIISIAVLSFQLGRMEGQAQDLNPTQARADQRPEVIGREWRPALRQAHETVWHSIRHFTNQLTGRIRSVTNTIVELATGLNRFDLNSGTWQAASPAFRITRQGAVADLGSHHVTLPGDINTYGSVQVRKDNLIFRAHPLCVAYYDPVDGRSYLLGELTSATGWLTASNEVVFSNCFDGLKASIRFRNTYTGLESDLILHEQPSVAPADLGFSPKARLELFTELVGETPNPELTTTRIDGELDPIERARLFEPDFVDQTLDFGALKMIRGKAFLKAPPADGQLRSPLSRDVPVSKRFQQIGDRRVLIEAVEHRRIAVQLATLPRSSPSGITNAMIREVRSRDGIFAPLSPPMELPGVLGASSGASEIQFADVSPERDSRPTVENSSASFVLDWQIVNNTPPLVDYVFYGTNVYWIRDALTLSGQTEFLGGTILKFDPGGAVLVIQGSASCDTTEVSPAVFTGRDDDFVGESLPGSTGSPARFGYGLDYLRFVGSTGVTLKHLQMKYSYNYPINFLNSGPVNEVWHCQIVSSLGIYAENVTVKIRNALYYDFAIAVDGAYFTADIQHMTGHTCWWYFVSELGTFSVWNSLMSDVPLPPGYTPPGHVAWYITDPQPPLFTSLGRGPITWLTIAPTATKVLGQSIPAS